jgi:hypothetical protein
LAALLNMGLSIGLAWWFVRRYQMVQSKAASVRKQRKVFFRLPAPNLRWRPVATIWLTLRQSVPMCLAGLVLAALMTFLQMGMNWDRGAGFVRTYADSMPSAMWVVGLVWAVVVGSGLFADEVSPRTGDFWRALPTSVAQLYSIKFMFGLVATLALLDGVAIAACWGSPNWGDYHSMNWSYIACFPLLHATMFGFAVFWTCLLRRPVIGGIATIVCFTLVTVAVEMFDPTREYDPINVYNNMHFRAERAGMAIDFSAAGYPVVATTMAILLCACAVGGWLALRPMNARLEPN